MNRTANGKEAHSHPPEMFETKLLDFWDILLFAIMFIFSIAKVVAVDVLSHWICAKDLIHLDSAFCTTASRNFLLDMFEKEYFTIGENFMSTDCLKYMNIRKVKLKTLSLNDDFGSRSMIRDLVTSKVRTLKIVGCRQWKLPRADLVSLFNACSMLRELELNVVQSCCDDVIVQFNPTILSQLTSISITVTDGNQFSDISIQHFISHCHLLEIVKLNFKWHLISSVEILKLMQSNPHLKHLTQSRRLQESEDSVFLLDWAAAFVSKPAAVSLIVKRMAVRGSYLTVHMSPHTTHNKSVDIIVQNTDGVGINGLLTRFADLSSLDVSFIYLSPSYVSDFVSELTQRHPNLTSLTTCLLHFPTDTQYFFEKFSELKHLSCVGDTHRPRFNISPVAPPDFEGFKLELYGCNESHNQTSSMLAQLIHAVPRLKQVSMSNIRSADRPDIETACKARGAELVWMEAV
jgi:hypothetical protein